MQTIALAPTTIETSRLGFGCARLLRTPTRKERQALLGAAFENGIRHFDVARMYGLGTAESELGRFARGRRDEVVLATKFGIEPSGATGALARLQAPARRAIRRFPALRPLARRTSGGLYEPRRYDADSARASLETSLRELGTDHLDLVFLHEPGPRDAVDAEGVAGYLEQARAAGWIGAWGVSGDPGDSLAIAALFERPPDVLQLREHVLAPAPPVAPGAQARITFGALSTATDAVLRHVRAGDAAAKRWQEATGVSCTDASAVASLLLRWALRANPDGVVLFSTTRSDRIAAAVADAAAVDGGRADPALDALEVLVERELRAVPASL
ncbi:MAG TPA: aldo/keto reductase [Solirubrobacteraceae bacterium]|nr:aldo/keto reductase [Solirubrobacteraceae bacterium]